MLARGLRLPARPRAREAGRQRAGAGRRGVPPVPRGRARRLAAHRPKLPGRPRGLRGVPPAPRPRDASRRRRARGARLPGGSPRAGPGPDVDRAAPGRAPELLPLLVRRGRARTNPAREVRRRALPGRLPAHLPIDQSEALFRQQPATMRPAGGTARSWRSSTPAGSGSRSSPGWTWKTSTSARAACGSWEGAEGAHRSPGREGRRGASGLPRRARGRAGRSSGTTGAAGSRCGACTGSSGPSPGGRARRAGDAAHPASHVRDPSAGRRRGPPPDPGALGHARLATTQRYTHVSADRLAKVYDAAHPGAHETAAGVPRDDGRLRAPPRTRGDGRGRPGEPRPDDRQAHRPQGAPRPPRPRAGGLAGTAADAFTLFERFEARLDEHRGNLRRRRSSWPRSGGATVLRRLEALLAVADPTPPSSCRARAR